MAPIAPTTSSAASGSGAKRLTARQKARARLADPLLPRKLHRENNVVSDSFIDSKRDKRTIRHSAFVSKISKSHPSSKKTLKRRRPSKKLVTTLESLGDALDDIAAESKAKGGDAMMDIEQALQGKVRHKSLKSRPGALKRKEKVVKGEMERFGRSLAQLATVTSSSAGNSSEQQQQQQHNVVATAAEEKIDTTEAPPAPAVSATSNRWAALRGFISATMEQNPAFLHKSS
ncbi:ribosome biogenesis protein SLX9-domain-containing protein [Apodospora peruviana]|uniref:Ribosome biogenesis protein SLX9 n=1 Tax=Apodospora peruviana TaxID=516989 RepID=A0AAE0IR91_9PEZI|nr:ribosome biogenesis protein SLX9-domain-containing protein [Apodospora peruviana]